MPILYRLYSSTDNSLGVESYLGYFEIKDDGYISRYVEIRSDGTALRYSESHDADRLGQLPEMPWDETEASKPEYGIVGPLAQGLFEAVWAKTQCDNDHLFDR